MRGTIAAAALFIGLKGLFGARPFRSSHRTTRKSNQAPRRLFRLFHIRSNLHWFATATTLVGLVLFTADAVGGTVAGTTNGGFSVNQSGAATYSVELTVPPGAADLHPDIQLIYNSRSNNGLLGVGWSLGGLSTIDRCVKTLAQDNANGPIGFDENDRFCIDGKRLVAISGQYGASGTEYRTELDDFSRVVSYGVAGSGPEFFRAWTKDGLILEYGNTADSKVEMDGGQTVRYWARNRISDTKTNYIDFFYLENVADTTLRIERIEYTGNEAASVLPGNKVQFSYESRADEVVSYTAGSLRETNHRLSKIETFSAGSPVLEYRISYDLSVDTGRSRLRSVTKCDVANNCLKPISFGWSEPSSSESRWTQMTDLFPPVPLGQNKQDIGTRLVDLNGDGRTDLVRYYQDNANQTTRAAFLSTGESWTEAPEYVLPIGYPIAVQGTSDMGVRFVDVNGDGLVDMLASRVEDSNRAALLNTGAGWLEAVAFYPPLPLGQDKQNTGTHLLDLNGDGLVDILRFFRSKSNQDSLGAFLNTGAGWTPSPEYTPPTTSPFAYEGISDMGVRFTDLNGDRLPDFVASRVEGNHKDAYLNTGSGWERAVHFDPPLPIGQNRQDTGTRIVDVNNDGLADITRSYYKPVTWQLIQSTYLNTGTGWVLLPNINSPPRWAYLSDVFAIEGHGDVGGRLADLNNDGLIDYIRAYKVPTGGVRNSIIGSGSSWLITPEFSPPNTVAIVDSSVSDTGTRLADINGDGLPDLVVSRVEGNHKDAYVNSSIFDLVTSITDSLGRKTTIEYAPLSDSAVYTKGVDAVFPEQDIQGSIRVVKHSSKDDGVGGLIKIRYLYESLKFHVQGRGFLGFSQITSVDDQTGISISTTYRQDFPFIGQISSSVTRLVDGTKVESSANTWDKKLLNDGKSMFPFVSASVVKTYEINDGIGNAPITTVTTSNAFDDYGNATSTVVQASGVNASGSGVETFTETTTNTFRNDTVNWLIGQLTKVTVTKELPDLTAATRTSSFDYFPLDGLLKREVVEPDRPGEKFTTDYTYDDFGNTIIKTVSGVGISTRSATTVYSADGRFAMSETNALGHTDTRTYDARFGVTASLTGPNGITTTWTYDGFGRKIKEVRSDGSEKRWSYELCDAQCPPGGIYKVTQQEFISLSSTAIGPLIVTYFDKLNRAFRDETQGFDGTKIFVDTTYNARGAAATVSRPYFESAAPMDFKVSRNSYDVLGRVESTAAPNGGVVTTTYAGLTTSVTNALNQTSVRKLNALGWLVEATDNLGGKVTYNHDPFGNVTEIDAGGVVTSLDYDIRGRKISMTDPDMGSWLYDYNVLGELTKQTDARNQVTTLEYDKLGRLKMRIEAEGTTEWTYDTATKGVGKLQSVTAPGGYLRTHAYDSLGRPSRTTTTVDGVNYVGSLTYDSAGRVETRSYPSGLTVRNGYTSRGHLSSVSEDGGTTVYWQANAMNAEGHVTQETFGNGVVTTSAYNAETGRIDTIGSVHGAAVVQDLDYLFDKLGNLKERKDLRQDRKEEFLYDGLNRLTTAALYDTAGAGSQLALSAYTYDALGNIKTKTGVPGIYLYGGAGAGPHAVTSAGGHTYAYDDNGNMTSGAGRTVTWTSFNKPALIAKTAGDSVGFTYGPDRARFKQHVVEGGVARDVIYIGSYYEKRIQFGSPDELVHYIVAGTTVAIHTIHDDGLPTTNKTRYLHRDHLGSVDTITGKSGAVIARLSFGPYGQRRLTDWQVGTPAAPTAETPRGFTGHEHLDAVSLIHMNGRVYEPTLGRFLSADPHVQFPETTQSFNRYSYVNNNPLSFTDPSGFRIYGTRFSPFSFFSGSETFTVLLFAVQGRVESKYLNKRRGVIDMGVLPAIRVTARYERNPFRIKRWSLSRSIFQYGGFVRERAAQAARIELAKMRRPGFRYGPLYTPCQDFQLASAGGTDVACGGGGGPSRGSRGRNDTPRAELKSLKSRSADSLALSGRAKSAVWQKSTPGREGPGLRAHTAKHKEQVGAQTMREYDLSARLTIQRGRRFSYNDKHTNELRIGYWDPKTSFFTSTSQRGNTTIIHTHYPMTWMEIRSWRRFRLLKP